MMCCRLTVCIGRPDCILLWPPVLLEASSEGEGCGLKRDSFFSAPPFPAAWCLSGDNPLMSPRVGDGGAGQPWAHRVTEQSARCWGTTHTLLFSGAALQADWGSSKTTLYERLFSALPLSLQLSSNIVSILVCWFYLHVEPKRYRPVCCTSPHWLN